MTDWRDIERRYDGPIPFGSRPDIENRQATRQARVFFKAVSDLKAEAGLLARAMQLVYKQKRPHSPEHDRVALQMLSEATQSVRVLRCSIQQLEQSRRHQP